MKDEAQHCFPVALRCLPTHLDVLHVDCPSNLYVHNEALYNCLKDANRDPARTINITELVIAFRPWTYDIFRHFAFTRNVVHFKLTITNRYNDIIFVTPLSSPHLESLVLHIHFGSSEFRRHMPVAEAVVKRVLRPACTKLQSFTLNLYDYDEVGPYFYAEATKEVLSLIGPSTSRLNLCGKPAFKYIHLAKVFTEANVFAPSPSLQHLQLNASSVSPDVFQQLECFSLQTLEVTVMEMRDPSSRDGVETMNDILASVELRELANLEHLVVNFSSLETSDKQYPLLLSKLGPWAGTKQAWNPLETTCALRHIPCTIRYPE
jgi:hypothetical protein